MADDEITNNTDIESAESTDDLTLNGSMPLPQNSSLKVLPAEVYNYINSCVNAFCKPAIDNLKNNVRSYKQECKNLQEKYDSLSNKLSKIEGKYEGLNGLVWKVIWTLLGGMAVMIWYYLTNIAPVLK